MAEDTTTAIGAHIRLSGTETVNPRASFDGINMATRATADMKVAGIVSRSQIITIMDFSFQRSSYRRLTSSLGVSVGFQCHGSQKTFGIVSSSSRITATTNRKNAPATAPTENEKNGERTSTSACQRIAICPVSTVREKPARNVEAVNWLAILARSWSPNCSIRSGVMRDGVKKVARV